MAKYSIVMIRHGQSEWDLDSRLPGWFDVALTAKGYAEAVTAGKTLKGEGYQFDVAHTSLLRRAHVTLDAILQEIGQPNLPVHKTWRLNEIHLGGLHGLSRSEVSAKYGKVQLEIWRRSYDQPPPPMEKNHLLYTTIVNDPRYATQLNSDEFPMAESFQQCYGRAVKYWDNVIVPQIKEGKNILISAHGNSLRGIVQHLDGLSNTEILNLVLPTGIPFVYELDEDLNPVYSLNYLGDEETVKKAMMDAIADERDVVK